MMLMVELCPEVEAALLRRAEEAGRSVAEVADVTWRNAAQVFRLDSPD